LDAPAGGVADDSKHAPPQLMQRRRARRQLEARQQLLERLEVE
jgi:hypothetical protein